MLAVMLTCYCLVALAHGTVNAANDGRDWSGWKLSERHVLHARAAPPSGWRRLGKAHPNRQVEFWIALKQYNVQELEKQLFAVSDPRSSLYGKHWTLNEIYDLIAPPSSVTQAVINFLLASGVEPQNIINRRDALNVKAPVQVVERIFKCKLHAFRKIAGSAGRQPVSVAALGPWSLPKSIAAHVDMVVGISDFPIPKRLRPTFDIEEAPEYPFPYRGKGLIVPEVVRRLYNISEDVMVTNANSSVAVCEFQGDDCFSYKDNALYLQRVNRPYTNVSRIIGKQNWQPVGCDGESTLDVQMVLGLAPGTPQVTYFSNVDWMYTYTQLYLSIPNPPKISSLSWGWMEADQCQLDSGVCQHLGINNAQYINRTDVEFMKLGVMGISILICTQDEGAPSDNNVDCSSSKLVWPIYPASSPYVTAVGGTALMPASNNFNFTSPICHRFPCCEGTVETSAMAPNSGYTSGGGFSDINKRQPWQETAVETWLNSSAIRPPAGQFSVGGRAYPDISAVGEMVYVVQGGNGQTSGGTSAATPIVSAIITLLNDWRLNHNKSTLGFLNPLLYEMGQNMPSAFNDITTGNNTCTGWGSDMPCCNNPIAGYGATVGWDPVTGWGSPNFGNMLEYIKAL